MQKELPGFDGLVRTEVAGSRRMRWEGLGRETWPDWEEIMDTENRINLSFLRRTYHWINDLKNLPDSEGFEWQEALAGKWQPMVVANYLIPTQEPNGVFPTQEVVARMLGWTEGRVGHVARVAMWRIKRRQEYGKRAIERLAIGGKLYEGMARKVRTIDDLMGLGSDDLRLVLQSRGAMRGITERVWEVFGIEWEPEVVFPEEREVDEIIERRKA